MGTPLNGFCWSLKTDHCSRVLPGIQDLSLLNRVFTLLSTVLGMFIRYEKGGIPQRRGVNTKVATDLEGRDSPALGRRQWLPPDAQVDSVLYRPFRVEGLLTLVIKAFSTHT